MQGKGGRRGEREREGRRDKFNAHTIVVQYIYVSIYILVPSSFFSFIYQDLCYVHPFLICVCPITYYPFCFYFL